MKKSILFPPDGTIGNDLYLNMAMAEAGTMKYPSEGIYSPYEIIRLVCYMLYMHIDAALTQVLKRATSNKEYPLDCPTTIKRIFLSPRPLIQINDYPACFVTFSGHEIMHDNMNSEKIIGGIDKKYTILVSPVIKEPDPDLQEIKMLRLASAIEYVLLDGFLNTSHNTPAYYNYLRIFPEEMKWFTSPSIQVEDTTFVKFYSLVLPVHKRFHVSS